ncbi:uncharacterized protein [Primulina huaijiensis]|uniref:uncharacterized protein n=1 Tax=Primulina huaijiensis TaxID=1492673 RepID=UPI003CC77A01
MSVSNSGEFGVHGKKKAKTGDLEDGPSCFRSLPFPPWYGMENVPDGGIEDSVVSAWKQQEDNGLDEELDPLMVFGSGIMMIIVSKLDARSVTQARLVSREWHAVASSDKIWAPKCEELWMGKAHIPRISKVGGLSKLAAYSLSSMDYKRTRITRNDLCSHVWVFHFTEAAPVYWRNMDPYWLGSGTPMRRYFHQDGSITADSDDGVWGGHESCYTVVTGLLEDGTIREHYVRINRWPQLSVRRKEDGSWELSNHLCCYTSVPDADREDGTGPPSPVF